MGKLSIKLVEDRRGRHHFVQVPSLLRDPRRVSPGPWYVDFLVDPERNPWFRHGEAALFVAYLHDEPVGRVCAHVDSRATATHGRFGLFECIEDPEVADALLRSAENWVRRRGFTHIEGPIDPTSFLTGGFLVQGFDEPTAVGTPFCPPHYAWLINQLGYAQVMDLFAWRYGRFPIPKQVRYIARAVEQAPDLEVRKVDLSRFESELDNLVTIYNRSYRDNWGFVPIDREDLRGYFQDGRRIDPEISFIATVNGELAAMAVGMPNLDEFRTDLPLSPAIERLGIRLQSAFRRPTGFRQLLFGIVPKFRGKALGGLGIYLYTKVLLASRARGYREGEATWTFSVQDVVNGGLKVMGAEHIKTYRMFEKEL